MENVKLPKQTTLVTNATSVEADLIVLKKMFGKRMPKGVAKSITGFGKIVSWLKNTSTEKIFTKVNEEITLGAKPKTKAARA